MHDIVLINPRFDVSFWGMEYALPLLAALTPPGFNVRIIDENVEPIPFDGSGHEQLPALARQLAQLALRDRGDEAAAQQPVLEQLRAGPTARPSAR
jgi:hypothetical protein